MDDRYELIHGDALQVLQAMPDNTVDCCVTSPPYYALRDYGYDGQIGLEHTPEAYIERLVSVFREMRRVLKPQGTCWVNIGDSYAAQCGGTHQPAETLSGGKHGYTDNGEIVNRGRNAGYNPTRNASAIGLKHKDLIGIPWMLAFALRNDGWYLRQDIIWAKTNCMPESVTDRCTKSHEYIFFLTKQSKYYYDADSIKTDSKPESINRYKYDFFTGENKHGKGRPNNAINTAGIKTTDGKANKRDVWFVPVSGGYTDDTGAHYATYSTKLIEPCILAGCPHGGVVLDMFNGTGTTGIAALKNGRKYIGIDMSKEYIEMARTRIDRETAQVNIMDLIGR